MTIPFYQVDVFTDRIFGGNPLAVFTEGQKFAEEDLIKVAREMNLSETTFVYPFNQDEADFDVRIFTPTQEIPFAGHPILGTTHVLREKQLISPHKNPIRLNLKAGIISVWREEDKDFMEHPNAQTLHHLRPSDNIFKALGITSECIDNNFPLQVVSTGFPALIIAVNSLSNLNRIKVNKEMLHQVLSPLEIDMIYPFCCETLNKNHTVQSRAFAPGLGIPEDPATGSVAGAMGAYWANLTNKQDIKMVIEQGYAMQRPSLITVEIKKKGNKIQKIRVGGRTKNVFCAQMDKA